MDSVTQAALGAAVGYVVGGKELGRKAMLWGACLGTLPDLDFLFTLPMDDEFAYLKYHRGFSHSLIFSVLGSYLGSAVAKRVHPTVNQFLYFRLFFLCIFTHSILDCFTSWGTQVFWPLASRISWNSIFIVDPAYTIPLLVALIAAFFFSTHQRRFRWIMSALVVTTAYLMLTFIAKGMINQRFDAIFESQDRPVIGYISRPTPFNIVLWSATAETEDGYYFAMASLLDRRLPDDVYYISKNHELVEGVSDAKVHELLSYTKGYFSVETYGDHIVVHDLRYGFLGAPWIHGEHFVFSYHLTTQEDGHVSLTVQNPRPKNTKQLLKDQWTRLKGV